MGLGKAVEDKESNIVVDQHQLEQLEETRSKLGNAGEAEETSPRSLEEESNHTPECEHPDGVEGSTIETTFISPSSPQFLRFTDPPKQYRRFTDKSPSIPKQFADLSLQPDIVETASDMVTTTPTLHQPVRFSDKTSPLLISHPLSSESDSEAEKEATKKPFHIYYNRVCLPEFDHIKNIYTNLFAKMSLGGIGGFGVGSGTLGFGGIGGGNPPQNPSHCIVLHSGWKKF